MAKLIGTAPNQVPTNADLGSLAYMDKDNFDANISELTLGALSRNITDTAVDVFVYDTSKDSDGGAWRKRTQGTSWYNETLNTATRGSRKEFPAVAVIVAESNQVTIYDGDDPDLPMWMVFNQLGFSCYSISSVTGVVARDGIIAASQAEHGHRLQNFVSDTAYFMSVSGKAEGTGLVNRNTAFIETTYDTSRPLVNSNANDVAMAVLPNAPIDAATGLPVPTIAVATDGGVSVIKDDGNVFDFTSATTPNTNFVSFTEDDRICFFADDSGANYKWVQIFDIPSSDVGYIFSGAPNNYYATYSNTGGVYPALAPGATSDANNDGLTFKQNVAVADPKGLGIGTIDQPRTTDPSNNMVAYSTSDYATGWMHGDIKLATLSDTDDTDVTGSELVTNGTFDTDLSGWTDQTNVYLTPSWNNGKLRLTWANNFSSWYGMEQFIPTEVGKTYVISADMTSSDSNAEGSYFYVYLGGSWVGDNGVTNGVYTRTFVAESTSTGIRTGHGNNNGNFYSGDYYEVDNISVRLAEEDRSVNGNGLQVFGTVTKNPVATGADLVAYSGFSTSNYLEQPYNSDLDFGTGDFCVMGWHKGTNTSGNIFTRWTLNGSTFYQVYLNNSRYRFQVTSSTNSKTADSDAVANTDVWNYITAIRLAGILYLYVNGRLVATTTGSTANLDDPTGTLAFGTFQGGSGASNSSYLALWRISATAPSPEQIKKIYEDEKFLFQENAQATLYGSSDAVTALAYDDSTNLLHVGTSAGRSVFQGLRRVDNTTTAVGAAISASNGLVADE
jgi:hypothetical protein